MNTVHHRITLATRENFADGLPPTQLGELLKVVKPSVRGATRMLIEGRSVAPGRRPTWLDRASDIRLANVDLKAKSTTLQFVAPTLLASAPDLFEQTELWPAQDVDPELTGFDLLNMIFKDVTNDKTDSGYYDPAMLSRILSFGNVLGRTYQSIMISRKGRKQRVSQIQVDEDLLSRANALRASTPESRLVRIAGELDMLRASTGSLTLLLDDGTEVHGTVGTLSIDHFHPFFRKRVLLHGEAIYRPSGRLLRIDSTAIESGEDAAQIWSRVPEPLSLPATVSMVAESARRGIGVNHFFGTLSGEESDDEFFEMLASQ